MPIKLEISRHSLKAFRSINSKAYQLKNAEVVLEKANQHYQAINATGSKGPAYGGYSFLECEFETLDLVAGGDSGVENRTLKFPTRNGKPYIRGNWMSGYLRDNARLIEVNGSFLRNFGSVSDSKPLDVEVTTVSNVKVKEGQSSYETIPIGTKFTVRMRVPLRGSKIKSVKDFANFLHMLRRYPNTRTRSIRSLLWRQNQTRFNERPVRYEGGIVKD